MKKSNKILTGLLLLVISCMVFTDIALKEVYKKINLDDPFKNYETIAIRPFRFLKIAGGNGFSVAITQGPKTDMKVMSTRRSFLRFSNNADTLLIRFDVMSNRQGLPTDLPVGLMISGPDITAINTEGTSNLIENWKGDSLKLMQTGDAASIINHLDVGLFTVSNSGNSVVRFGSANKAKTLDINLTDNALVYLHEIAYQNFTPVIKNEAQLIFSATAAAKLKTP